MLCFSLFTLRWAYSQYILASILYVINERYHFEWYSESKSVSTSTSTSFKCFSWQCCMLHCDCHKWLTGPNYYYRDVHFDFSATKACMRLMIIHMQTHAHIARIWYCVVKYTEALDTFIGLWTILLRFMSFTNFTLLQIIYCIICICILNPYTQMNVSYPLALVNCFMLNKSPTLSDKISRQYFVMLLSRRWYWGKTMTTIFQWHRQQSKSNVIWLANKNGWNLFHAHAHDTKQNWEPNWNKMLHLAKQSYQIKPHRLWKLGSF